MTPRPSTDLLMRRLGLDQGTVRRLMDELAGHGLIRGDSSDAWVVTDAGQRAVIEGEFPVSKCERRAFRLLADSRVFLPLVSEGAPATPAGDVAPALNALRACAARPLFWKYRFHFPEDVEEILDLATESLLIPEWKRVPLEQTERHVLAVVKTNDERAWGFAVRPDWSLNSLEPVMRLEYAAAAEALGLREPDMAAWREWCRTIGGVDADDVEACGVERMDSTLKVKAPARLAERLKAARPEVFNGGGWILVGEPTCRAAVQIELVSK